MKGAKYTLLRSNAKELLEIRVEWIHRALQVAGILGLSALAFCIGRSSVYADVHPEVELRTRSQLFEFNKIYGDRPSNTTNQAWAELFPKQGGFFRHPQLAPERSALSVFHLLHCVDGIRHGYWTVLDAALAGERVNEEKLPFMASPKHVRHCIDLIRNSLMCYPDTTIELKNPEVGGVTGFGTVHQCRDWSELVEWTSKWESYDQHRDQEAGQHDENDVKSLALDQHHKNRL